MGTLTLIRHGQASFGAADYDQLSEIGQEQSRRLGAYLGHKNVHADVVYRGSLKRHAQTWMGMQEGLALTLGASYQAAVATVNPALDEYDGEALINAVKTDALGHSEGAEAYKQHFRLLRDALGLWMHGQISPKGMPTYALFKSQLLDVMQHICDTHQGQNVWVVSSGGPPPPVGAGGGRQRVIPVLFFQDFKATRGGTRTRNLLLRREAPYPLGHTGFCPS